jgi:hypothetical protein
MTKTTQSLFKNSLIVAIPMIIFSIILGVFTFYNKSSSADINHSFQILSATKTVRDNRDRIKALETNYNEIHGVMIKLQTNQENMLVQLNRLNSAIYPVASNKTFKARTYY